MRTQDSKIKLVASYLIVRNIYTSKILNYCNQYSILKGMSLGKNSDPSLMLSLKVFEDREYDKFFTIE